MRKSIGKQFSMKVALFAFSLVALAGSSIATVCDRVPYLVSRSSVRPHFSLDANPSFFTNGCGHAMARASDVARNVAVDMCKDAAGVPNVTVELRAVTRATFAYPLCIGAAAITARCFCPEELAEIPPTPAKVVSPIAIPACKDPSLESYAVVPDDVTWEDTYPLPSPTSEALPNGPCAEPATFVCDDDELTCIEPSPSPEAAF